MRILIFLLSVLFSTKSFADIRLVCTSSDRTISWSVWLYDNFRQAKINQSGEGSVEKTEDFYLVDYKERNFKGVIKINRTSGDFMHMWKNADFNTLGKCQISKPKF